MLYAKQSTAINNCSKVVFCQRALKEGDCIEIAEDGSISINVEETEKRRKATSNLLKSLLKR